jgi:hypothetical protein
MALSPTEDTKLGAQALAYVIELYRELTVENGAPTLGTQNQAVDFIRSDPELRRAVSAWAEAAKIDEATMAPRQRLPQLSRTDHDSVGLPLNVFRFRLGRCERGSALTSVGSTARVRSSRIATRRDRPAVLAR